MNELSGAPVAEGWWCQTCEFYEDDDEINAEMEMCVCCGCSGASHIRVDVVAR